MKTLIFVTQRVNVNGLWRARVVTEGETLPSDRLESLIMNACQLDRRTMDCLRRTVQTYVVDELSEGNAVSLFDLVRLKAEWVVDRPAVGSEAEAEALVAGLSAEDVSCRVTAHVPCTSQRRLVNGMRRKHLRIPRRGSSDDA